MNRNLVYLIGILIIAFILYTVTAMGSFAQPTTYNQSGLSFQYPNNWFVVSNGSSSNVWLNKSSYSSSISVESYTNYTGDLGKMSSIEQATDRVSNFVFIGNKSDNGTNIQYGEYAVYSSFGDGSIKERTVYLIQKGSHVYVLSEYTAAG